MDTSDGGYSSRKMMMALVTMGFITVGAVSCGFWPALIPIYDTFSNGIIGALAIYTGGNAATKWVLSKKTQPVKEETPRKKASKEPSEGLEE